MTTPRAIVFDFDGVIADSERLHLRAYQDIQQAVNAITTLPAAADPPRITLAGRSRSVVSLQVYGRVGQEALHDAAENVRAELRVSTLMA